MAVESRSRGSDSAAATVKRIVKDYVTPTDEELDRMGAHVARRINEMLAGLPPEWRMADPGPESPKPGREEP